MPTVGEVWAVAAVGAMSLVVSTLLVAAALTLTVLCCLPRRRPGSAPAARLEFGAPATAPLDRRAVRGEGGWPE